MTKLFPIIAIAKLKKTDLNIADAHNLRKICVPNADGTQNYERIFGDSNQSLKKEIEQRIQKYEINRIQKNSVVALEFVLSASPEFFRRNAPKSHDDYCSIAIERWVEISLNFLKIEFNEHLVNVDLHLDEATPHLHAIVFPINKKLVAKVGRKPNANICSNEPQTLRYCLDVGSTLNKQKLTYFLDRYSSSTACLGLIRPKKNEQAKHKKLKTYREEIFKKETMTSQVNELEKKLNETMIMHIKMETELKIVQDKCIFEQKEMKEQEKQFLDKMNSIRNSTKQDIRNFAVNCKITLDKIAQANQLQDAAMLFDILSSLKNLQNSMNENHEEEFYEVIPDVLR
jgi:hypothetical protein